MVMKTWGCWSNWTLSSVSSSSFFCSECIFVVLWLFPLPFFLVCLYPSFSGHPRFSAFSPILSVLPYVRPFSGFYKAKEGHKSHRRSCVHASRNEARSVRDRGPWSAGCVSCWSGLQDEEMMNSVRSKRHRFHPKWLFSIWPWTSNI